MMHVASVAVVAVVVSIAATALWESRGGEVRSAGACGIGVEPIENIVARADAVVLVDVLAVGGAENSVPPYTPQPTFTPSPWFTGTASPTPEPSASPTSTSSPLPTPTALNLVGYGATARIVKTYKGSVGDPVEVDSQARLGVERGRRFAESLPDGVRAPCDPGFGVRRYEPGARYLLMGASNDAGGIEVEYYGFFLIAGDEVILADESVPPERRTHLALSPEMYDRYFRDVDVDTENDPYFVRAPRIPLAQFEAAILGLPPPERQPITPPVTGNAGLKSAAS